MFTEEMILSNVASFTYRVSYIRDPDEKIAGLRNVVFRHSRIF
jgi:hypothetical protein